MVPATQPQVTVVSQQQSQPVGAPAGYPRMYRISSGFELGDIVRCSQQWCR